MVLIRAVSGKVHGVYTGNFKALILTMSMVFVRAVGVQGGPSPLSTKGDTFRILKHFLYLAVISVKTKFFIITIKFETQNKIRCKIPRPHLFWS